MFFDLILLKYVYTNLKLQVFDKYSYYVYKSCSFYEVFTFNYSINYVKLQYDIFNNTYSIYAVVNRNIIDKEDLNKYEFHFIVSSLFLE